MLDCVARRPEVVVWNGRRRRLFAAGLLATLVWPVIAAARLPAQHTTGADFQKLLADKAAAIVTVKFVLKVNSSWGDSENEREISGVMIEPDGLVMCSNTLMGGFRARGRRSRDVATPRDIKILIGDDTEGLDAQLVARDTELDLAWIRIEDPGEARFATIDLSASVEPAIGEPVYSLTRMGKYFDRAPLVREARLGGVTSKPRPLYLPSGGSSALGLPVFNADGAVVGVTIRQTPEEDELGGGQGWGGAFGVILPASEAVRATQRAKEILNSSDDEAGAAAPAAGSGG